MRAAQWTGRSRTEAKLQQTVYPERPGATRNFGVLDHEHARRHHEQEPRHAERAVYLARKAASAALASAVSYALAYSFGFPVALFVPHQWGSL